MKPLLLSFLFLPLLLPAREAPTGSFLITGKVKNARSNLLECLLTSYLGGTRIALSIGPDGSFSKSIPVQDRQNFYLNLNNEPTGFTVQEKDTLTLSWDDQEVPGTFSIRATGPGRTEELQAQWKLHRGSWTSYADLMRSRSKERTPDSTFRIINGLYNRKMETALQLTGITPAFTNRLATDIYFFYTGTLQRFNLLPNYPLKLNPELARAYPGLDLLQMDSAFTRMEESWFLNSPDYREFLDQQFNWRRLQSSLNGTSSVSQNAFNLAKAGSATPLIRDWLITQTLLFDFAHYAFDDVEAVYRQAVDYLTTPHLKDTLQQYYAAVSRLRPGSPAPDFALENEKGETVRLSDFRGKVVYIDFWGVDCGPCLRAFKQDVPRLHELYKEKEVVFLNICVDDSGKRWKETMSNYELKGVNLTAPGWTNNPAVKAYNIRSIPHYVLIGKDGKIVNGNARDPDELISNKDRSELAGALK